MDKYTSSAGSPARIAIGADGTLYVTDPSRGIVEIFSNNGVLLYTLTPTEAPLGIAVDLTGRMIISDSKRKNVGIYRGSGDAERGSLLFKAGTGDGEFGLPNGIAVARSGNIYVTDSRNNVVKYFSSDGTFLGSFGAGVLNFPTGISVDNNDHIYVIDHNNLLIRYYNLNGALLGTINEACGGGMLGGCKNLLRPLGISSDSSRLYVTDAFHSAVAVYDKEARTFLGYIGQYGTEIGEYRTPVDLAFDRDNKLFVTNSNNQRVEVLGVDAFYGLGILPSSLDLTLYKGGMPSTVNLQVNSLGSTASWTASVTSPWIAFSQSSGSTPSAVAVTFDPAGLSAGQYSEYLRFQTASGIESLVPVSVQVKKPYLVASQANYSLVYQKGSGVLPSATIRIDSVGAVLNWTATSDSAWLQLDRTSGTTPASVGAVLTRAVTRLAPGSYDANVTIAEGDTGESSVTVQVRLIVMIAGNITVRTNLENASFAVTGPESFSGSGLSWTKENVVPGTYSISFSHVSGYNRPPVRTFSVTTGVMSEVNATYAGKTSGTHVIAGAGGPDAGLVSMIPLAGGPAVTISPFVLSRGVKVAAGDLNGDGTDELIAANGINAFRVYDRSGRLILSKSLGSSASDLEIAAGDIDGDGVADIVVTYLKSGATVVQAYGLKGASVKKKKALALKQAVKVAQTLALGDVNGDGRTDLILASASYVRAYSLNPLSLLWSSALNETLRPNISAGDINDDGVDEIALALGPAQDNGAEVRFLKADGSDLALEIHAYDGYMYGATVAIGDIDGDGVDDIVVGAGPAPANDAVIKLYRPDGTYTGTAINALPTFYGVNVGLGNFGE